MTPIKYECDEDGRIIGLDESIAPDWIDGLTFYGFWCPDCGEWHNEGNYRDEPDEDEVEETSWERLAEVVDEDGEFHA